MNDFYVNLLGVGSAKPSVRHNPSSAVVEHRQNLYMVDCGEGAQRAFQAQHLKFSRLRHIFLTHLHGDHVFGLPGLVGTLGLSGKEGALTIHTFEDGAKILKEILGYFSRQNPIDVEFNILDPTKSQIALDTKSLTVRTVPLRHSLPAVGYIFEEKPSPRHILPEMVELHRIPFSQINNIKAGADFTREDGVVIPNSELTLDPARPRKYAHISDTKYLPQIVPAIQGADVLYHETTYLNESEKDAAARGHSTARQAGMIARDAGVGTLITGHYSSRYRDEQEFQRQAAEVFDGKIIVGNEGLKIEI